jgi:hypothetical protein
VLLSDGERLTGAYAPGPEAGKWLQQATLAIRDLGARFDFGGELRLSGVAISQRVITVNPGDAKAASRT